MKVNLKEMTDAAMSFTDKVKTRLDSRLTEATTLAAMSWTNKEGKPAYHTRRDTIEAVDRKAVSISIDMGINYILKKEAAIN